MRDPARTARRAGLAAAAVLLIAAAIAQAHNQLDARLLLWIAAAATGAPAVLHALAYGLPAAAPEIRPAPAPAAIAAARAHRDGLPPSPRRRQLTS